MKKNVQEKSRKENKIPWLVLGLVFLMLVFLNLFYLENWLDSDMAAEMIFSKLLSEEGKWLATDSWYYSTEFRVLYTQILMEPLFFIFRDWHTIRVITNLLTYLLLVGSYFYMMKPLRLRSGLVVFTSVLLLLPFSETFLTHMQMGNTYMWHLLLICFVFGLFLRLSENAAVQEGAKNKGQKAKNAAMLFFYSLLSLICGLSGVRYLLALQVPMVFTAAVVLIKSEAFSGLRREVSADRMKVLFSGIRLSYLFYSLLGAVWALAGYALNVLAVAESFDFQTYEVTNFISVYQGIFLERLQNILGSLLMLFGYIPDKAFLSLRGAVTLAAFVMLGGIFFLTWRTGRLLALSPSSDTGNARGNAQTRHGEIGKRESGGNHRRFLLCFLIVAFAVNTFVFLFTTSTMVPRYYLTVYLFVPPMIAVYFEEEKMPLDRIMAAAVLCACLVLATGKCVYSFVSTDKNEDKRSVCKFLEEEGYTFGYGTYWNANIITELTNGTVEVANVDQLDQLNYFYWSSPKKYYEEEHSGKTFLLLTVQEKEEYAEEPVVSEGKIVYEDESYVVYHFDDVSDWEAYRNRKQEED